MEGIADATISSIGKRLGAALCALALLCLVALALPGATRAGVLTDAQRSTLMTALAAKKSFVEIFALARQEGIPCDATVGFLCEQTQGDLTAAYEIVYVACQGGCSVEAVVAAALKGGASLPTVIKATLAANADPDAVRRGAAAGGATAEQIANAFAGITVGGGAGGTGGLTPGGVGGPGAGGGGGTGIVPGSGIDGGLGNGGGGVNESFGKGGGGGGGAISPSQPGK